MQCQLILLNHDRVRYPQAKRQLDSALHSLCKIASNTPSSQTCQPPKHSEVQPPCSACEFYHGRPQSLWDALHIAGPTSCICQVNECLLKVGRLYGRFSDVLGGPPTPVRRVWNRDAEALLFDDG